MSGFGYTSEDGEIGFRVLGWGWTYRARTGTVMHAVADRWGGRIFLQIVGCCYRRVSDKRGQRLCRRQHEQRRGGRAMELVVNGMEWTVIMKTGGESDWAGRWVGLFLRVVLLVHPRCDADADAAAEGGFPYRAEIGTKVCEGGLAGRRMRAGGRCGGR